MPTKQEIEDFLKEKSHNSPYLASIHFNINISDVYSILEEQTYKQRRERKAPCIRCKSETKYWDGLGLDNDIEECKECEYKKIYRTSTEPRSIQW